MEQPLAKTQARDAKPLFIDVELHNAVTSGARVLCFICVKRHSMRASIYI